MQKMLLKAGFDLAYGEMNAPGTEEIVLQAPVSGWLSSIVVDVLVDAFNDNAAFGLLVSSKALSGNIGGYLPKFRTVLRSLDVANHNASAVLAPATPVYFWVPGVTSGVTANEQFKLSRKKIIDEFVEQGEPIYCYLFWDNIGNTYTDGGLEISFNFEYNVAERKSNKRNTNSSEVVVMGVVDNTYNDVFWQAPSDGRISNIILTLMGNHIQDLSEESYLFFGNMTANSANVINDTFQQLPDGVILNGVAEASALGDYFILTNYSRKIMFAKKSDLFQIQWKSDPTSETSNFPFIVEFDFIPDFNAPIDLVYKSLENDISGVFIDDFSVPFDMFVTDFEFDYRLNDESVDLDIYFMLLKDNPSNLSELNILGGSLLGSDGVGDDALGVLPSSVFDVVQHGAESKENYVSKNNISEFVPGESRFLMIFDVEVSAGTEDIDFTAHVSGYARVKSSKFGINYLSGDVVYNLEEVLG
jgi:hypothetical protein